MQEWLNWHAWKACVPQKGTAGSNPALSASKEPVFTGFCFLMESFSMSGIFLRVNPY